MGAGWVPAPGVIIIRSASGGRGLLESSGLEVVSIVFTLRSIVEAHLIDRDTAGIVLIIALGEHQLSRDGVVASASWARWCWRRREIVAVEIGLCEGLAHCAELGILQGRGRGRT